MLHYYYLLLLMEFFTNCCICYEFAGVTYDLLPSTWSSNKSLAPPIVPLTSVVVHLDVRGLTVGISAELKYENPIGEKLETNFVFPLSNEAAVYRLEAVIADRHLVAKVERREQAVKIYQEAVDAGKKAVLLQSQQGSGDIFRLSLGNLPAYGSALITIGYVQPIDRIYDDGLLSITLPMVLNPRYVPHHELINPVAMATKFTNAGEFIAVSDVAYKMTFDAKINLGLDRSVSLVTCRHDGDKLDVQYSQDGQETTASLLNDFNGDHDFQLLVRPSDPFEPMIYLEPRVKQYDNIWLVHDILAAWIVPRRHPGDIVDPASFEFWLVVDRSGSMYGTKISDAKSALTILVSKLPFGCHFNIIGFGSNFKPLFDKVVLYDNNTAAEINRYLQSIDADFGGTEILQPLQFIYDQNKVVPAGNERFILLLTDGEVSNTDQVIRLVQRNAATTRVFAIGIGEGASTALVNGVARVSGGLSAFVRGANDRLETKALDMFMAMTRSRMVNATLEWAVTAGGRLTMLIPQELPPVYADNPICQYAVIERFRGQRVTGSSYFTAANAMENCTGGCRLHFQLESGVSSEATDTLPLHRLAAKKMLTSLEDRYKESRQDSDRDEAVAISIATGVLCDFTAMVAVDTETDEAVVPAAQVVDKIQRENSGMQSSAKIAKSYSTSSASSSALNNNRNKLLLLLLFFIV